MDIKKRKIFLTPIPPHPGIDHDVLIQLSTVRKVQQLRGATQCCEHSEWMWDVGGAYQRMAAIRIKRRAKDSDSFQSAQSLRKDLPCSVLLPWFGG